MRGLVGLLLLLAVAGTLATRRSDRGEAPGSLRGVLRALERRRRAPQGPYPLVSYQDREPEELDYYGKEDYHDGLDRLAWKDVILKNLEKDEDYPVEYPSVGYRERQMAALKKPPSVFRELESKNNQEQVFGNTYEEKDEEAQSDDEYAELLGKLWEKYKITHEKQPKEYKRSIKKRQIPGEYMPTGGWGPVAFKRKRSSNQRLDNNDPPDFLYSLKFVSQGDPAAVENLKDDKVMDEEEDADIAAVINNRVAQSKYANYESQDSQPLDLEDDQKLAMQPLGYSAGNEMYLLDGGEIIDSPVGTENIYPISKRSSGMRGYVKRNLQDKNKKFRSAYNDPKVMKDLSSLFGSSSDGTIQKPVKRSSSPDEESHESKPPIVLAHHFNDSSHEQIHNETEAHNHPHSRHEHENKPPLMTNNNDHSHEGTDKKPTEFEDDEASHIEVEHPIILRKKSIDWSNYFGIDLNRRKKSMGYLGTDANTVNWSGEKKSTTKVNQSTLDNKLKNIESLDGGEDELEFGPKDTKEEQEIKEALLNQLSKAYNVEKMTKAIKELKTLLLKNENHETTEKPAEKVEEKEKRSETKAYKPKTELDPEDIKAILDEDEFGSEQGAGHYLNGPYEIMSEGYSRGNGIEDKKCPILERIIKKCHTVDELAGDHGQLFLPLCSLHQVCYICGPSSRTGCDLIFLSEADSACGGSARCQGAARGALMALRDAHEPIAHLGECAAYSCLNRALQQSRPAFLASRDQDKAKRALRWPLGR